MGNEIEDLKESFDSVWDSVCSFLTQEQIDEIERIHRNDLEKLGIYD